MDTNFHLSVDVNVGLTPALQTFLESFFKMSASVTEDPVKKPAAKPKKVAVTSEEQQEELEQVKQENPAVAKLQDKLDLELVEKKPTEIIRAAMTACRERIEGKDYTKESPYHKELTAEFKRIAALLGSERPSELPADKVSSFVNAINALDVEDGKIVVPEAF